MDSSGETVDSIDDETGVVAGVTLSEMRDSVSTAIEDSTDSRVSSASPGSSTSVAMMTGVDSASGEGGESITGRFGDLTEEQREVSSASKTGDDSTIGSTGVGSDGVRGRGGIEMVRQRDV